MDPKGVGEGNIVGGGSWDRGCWPGRFMPMGLWAAAEFRCIWLGWLLLIPVVREKKGSGAVCAMLGKAAGLSSYPLHTPARLMPTEVRASTMGLCWPQGHRLQACSLEAKRPEFWSSLLQTMSLTRRRKQYSAALGLVLLHDKRKPDPGHHPPTPRARWEHRRASITTGATAGRGSSSHARGPPPGPLLPAPPSGLTPGPEPCGGGGGGSRGRSGSSSSSEVAMVLMALW